MTRWHVDPIPLLASELDTDKHEHRWLRAYLDGKPFEIRCDGCVKTLPLVLSELAS